MNPPALVITALEKRYPRFALGPIHLTVPSGVIYGLIGPNGAGKTTLLDQIFGIGMPDAGSIQVSGRDHRQDEVAIKQRTAYAGPDLSYVSWGKVGRAVRFVRGFHPDWDDGLATRLMQSFGLSEGDRIATLSFGGRMKLALLLAMAWRPQFLVLDEPTTGLDAHAKKSLFSELLAIVRDEARTVLLSSHQITDLERFADHVSVLHQGRLLLEGPTAELVERHVQVEFEGRLPVPIPGLTIFAQEGSQCRAVVDTQALPLTQLVSHGAHNLHSQALTLEELFLALTS